MPDCLLPTFEALTSNQIEKINENSIIVKYKKGEVICRENHPISHILFLKSGLIKLSKEYQKDRSLIIGILGPKGFFGIVTIYGKGIYQISVTTLDECEVVHTNFDVFKDILFKNGKYTCNLMDQISSNSLLLIRKMISTTFKQVPGRLAELLLFFARIIYNSNTYNLPLSRLEIAEFIASTKETVSRTITEFKNDRIIDIEGTAVTLNSVDLLEKLSIIG